MSHIARDLANLSPLKQQLVRELLDAESNSEDSHRITRADVATKCLSFGQERLWFLDQLAAGTGLYHVVTAYRVRGPLRIEALERSLTTIIGRHETLRTAFRSKQGERVLVVRAAEPVRVEVIQLERVATADREAVSYEAAVQEARRPFDLAEGPLMRVAAIRLDAEDHLLVLTLHHIIADGWSAGVLARELSVLYAAEVRGKPATLPPPTIQYSDFAAWQRARLQGETLATELRYWQTQLAGAPPVLELPADRPRPAVQSFRGARVRWRVTGSVVTALRALSRREGVTLFMTLLASFKVLLARYTGETDLVVGTPIANRSRAEVEPLIGCFANTLALRTDLSGEPTFREVLHRVRRICLDAYAHQDVPFDRLVEALQPVRDASRQPLISVSFQLLNAPPEPLELSGAVIERISIEAGATALDLNLVAVETADGLAGTLEYSKDVFEAERIERLVGHYACLLRSVAAVPETRIWELQLSSDAEKQQLLVQWQPSCETDGSLTPVHLQIEMHATATPDAVAVSDGEQAVTYAALVQRAANLEGRLRAAGVVPGHRVAILQRNGVNHVTAMLGVLRSGAAFTCLDPNTPTERLRHILADVSPAALVIEDAQAAPLLEVPDSVAVVDVNDDERIRDWQSTIVSGRPLDPSYPAYIAYTSGSTGKPKGIVQSHRSFARFLTWFQRAFELRGGARVGQWVSVAFDPAYAEIFGALCSGATVCVIPAGHRADPRAVVDWVHRDHVSVLQVVPSFLRELLKTSAAITSRSSPLRWLLAAGEVLPASLAQKILQGPDAPQLVNLYGPTETVVATSHTVTAADGRGRAISIGRPLPGCEVLILDKRRELCPVGVPGELYVASDHLTEGYCGDPGATALAFGPNSLGARRSRSYRTGDLGRWRSDGTIEFLGRRDQQVKIRGMRVELGEVEAVLSNHPDVSECTVLAQSHSDGGVQLVGYVGAVSVTDAEVRTWLRSRLPEYMVPGLVLVLPILPKTATGKIDRQALPRLTVASVSAADRTAAERTPLEELIARVWADVLSLPDVGLHENFFDLGGHSLLAMQVVNRIREVCNIDVPLQMFFGTPTVATLVDEIESARRRPTRPLLPLEPTRRDSLLAPSLAQERLWFWDQLAAGTGLYNVATAYRVRGPLRIEALERSLRTLIGRHETLRTTFRLELGELVSMVRAAGQSRVQVIRLEGLAAADREAAAHEATIQEARRSFDLAEGPLTRVVAIKLDAEDHVLVLTLHHIIADGSSVGVLARELSVLYAAEMRGEPAALPRLAIQYGDFAVWQRAWLQDETLASELRYWQEQLAGAPPVLALPADRPRPAVQNFRGASVRWRMVGPVVTALRGLSRREGVTVFMTLLAAFKVLLARYTDETDLVVAMPIANRRWVEVEPLIGCFVNRLMLRTNLSGDPSFREVLHRVRRVCLDAYAHQDVPFERMVEALQPARDLSRLPLIQVSFELQNAPRAALALSGLRVQQQPIEPGVTMFDLNVVITEREAELTGVIEYSAELFDAATIEALVRQYERIVGDVTHNASARISELPSTSD